jgi:hypothetical protein
MRTGVWVSKQTKQRTDQIEEQVNKKRRMFDNTKRLMLRRPGKFRVPVGR